MKSNRRGFTLIEVLVVILIIAILAAIALPQYQKVVEKSRAAEAKITLKTIANAEDLYFLTHGEYAYNFEDLELTVPTETNDWEYYFNESIGAGSFSVLAWNKHKNYGVVFVKGDEYEEEGKDQSFLCTSFEEEKAEGCSIFGPSYTMDVTGWKVVKIK